jgi:hypothetical protein
LGDGAADAVFEVFAEIAALERGFQRRDCGSIRALFQGIKRGAADWRDALVHVGKQAPRGVLVSSVERAQGPDRGGAGLERASGRGPVEHHGNCARVFQFTQAVERGAAQPVVGRIHAHSFHEHGVCVGAAQPAECAKRGFALPVIFPAARHGFQPRSHLRVALESAEHSRGN